MVQNTLQPSQPRGEGWIRKEKCWVESESLRRAARRGHSRGCEPESGWGRWCWSSRPFAFVTLLTEKFRFYFFYVKGEGVCITVKMLP